MQVYFCLSPSFKNYVHLNAHDKNIKQSYLFSVYICMGDPSNKKCFCIGKNKYLYMVWWVSFQ